MSPTRKPKGARSDPSPEFLWQPWLGADTDLICLCELISEAHAANEARFQAGSQPLMGTDHEELDRRLEDMVSTALATDYQTSAGKTALLPVYEMRYGLGQEARPSSAIVPTPAAFAIADMLIPEASLNLAFAVQQIIDQIWRLNESVRTSPSRASVRAKLGEIVALARRLAALLGDPELEKFQNSLWRPGFYEIAPEFIAHLDMPFAPDRLNTLAASAEWDLKNIMGGRGSRTLHDALRIDRGHRFCAMAVRMLFEVVYGKSPSKTNKKALEVCVMIWEAAGGSVSEGVISGDTDAASAWERHLRDTRPRAPTADWELTQRDQFTRWVISRIFQGARLGDIFPRESRQ